MEQLIQLVEREIHNIGLPKVPQGLYAPIEYTLESGGKRIRPLMVMLASQAYGAKQEYAIHAAMAIEVFHNFTLLHDDIMDNAQVRRARATVHKKWDANTAILSGDAMIIHAYKLLAKCAVSNFADIMDTFGTLAALVCEGQQYDMDFEQRDDVTIDEYIYMISLKTSALIAGALKMGAQIAGAPEGDCNALYDFGMNLGTAFQLQDDLLDSFGDASTFGKRIGGDIVEGKKTYLLLTAFERGDEQQREQLRELLASTAITESEKIKRVKELYSALKVEEAASEMIAHYFQRASEILLSLDITPERREPLVELANKLVNRDK